MLLFGGGLLHVCSVRESFRPTWISISSGVVPFALGSLQIVLVLELLHSCMERYDFWGLRLALSLVHRVIL